MRIRIINLFLYITYSLFSFSQEIKKGDSTIGSVNTDMISKDFTKNSFDSPCKFNILIGTVINSTFSNVPRKENSGKNYSTLYEKEGKNVYNGNINVGFNFLFGHNHRTKFIIGCSYLRSEGNFLYLHTTMANSTYTEKKHYTSKADFVNISSGISISLGKHFRLDPLLSFNYLAHSDVKVTGEATTTTYYGYNQPPLIETISYTNEKPQNILIENTISFCPRLQYELEIKQQIYAIYLSYNFAYEYRLPWIMSGITLYPFKKLR